MKYFLIILSVALIISIALNLVQCQNAERMESYRNEELDRFQKEQSRKLTVIAKRDSVISSMLIDRKSDSAKYSREQEAFKSRLIALRKRVTGPPVVQDTIIVVQDSLIRSIETELDTVYLADNAIIQAIQQNKDSVFLLYQNEYFERTKYQSRYEAEKKKRFSIGPHAGYGFKGPDFGVSIQYSLWRF